MTQSRLCWGVYRERSHSPGRIDDDAAIVQSVAEALRGRGFDVRLVDPADAGPAFETAGANIFAMCEQSEILDRLDAVVAAGGVVVNSPDAIRNTYRRRTIELFARKDVLFPASQVVLTNATTPPPAPKVWLKRSDFHATQADDVLFADSEDAWFDALALFAARGMRSVVVQEHVPGDLVKFYGVIGAGTGRWFDWFYHKDQDLSGFAFDRDRLANAAFGAASALELEVFGGDAIITAAGAPFIIDVNAWPSFARLREPATVAISDHLASVFDREVSSISRFATASGAP